MRKRICFVIQRYGKEINGGAELHCRQLAEHLKKQYDDIHVATTKAIDYITWKNEYKKDEEVINDIVVHRFPVDYERNQKKFLKVNDRLIFGDIKTDKDELEWVLKQGPVSTKLIKYIKDKKDEYDVFIFFTYLYYPTIFGIEEVKDKAIVIPTAHDETPIHMKIYRKVFNTPRAFFYNTSEERELVNRLFHNENIPSLLGGVGVDLPKDINPKRFKEKYHLDQYIVYVGRIDRAKNCEQLFDFFLRYVQQKKKDIKLVLMGKEEITVPNNKNIVSLGFVSDQDKFDGISGAISLIMPSEFESLSMVVLEAMSLYTPVIVNGRCPVLKGHCIKSNGAFYYNNYYEFAGELDYILSHIQEKEIMCNNAKKYVEENYEWNSIVERLTSLIEEI